MAHNHIGLKEIVSQSKKLLRLAETWEKEELKSISPIRSLGQSYLLFILSLNNSDFSPLHQRKVLQLSHEYGIKAHEEIKEITKVEDHPYFGLLFCLLHIARGQWDLGTKVLHSLSKQYPDPTFYKVLVKLYTKIELPNVAKYFEKKLNHFDSDSALDSGPSEENSVLRSVANFA